MVFGDGFYTVTFMREGKIPQNWKDLVQNISQSSAPDNIDLKDNWFTIDLEKDTRENPTHVPIVTP